DFCEIELTLFENCNVACAFCAHDKKSTSGMTRDEMLAKIPLVKDFLKTVQSEVAGAHLHMVGGELLQDRLVRQSPHFLATYEDIIQSFLADCLDLGLDGKVYIVTN